MGVNGQTKCICSTGIKLCNRDSQWEFPMKDFALIFLDHCPKLFFETAVQNNAKSVCPICDCVRVRLSSGGAGAAGAKTRLQCLSVGSTGRYSASRWRARENLRPSSLPRRTSYSRQKGHYCLPCCRLPPPLASAKT